MKIFITVALTAIFLLLDLLSGNLALFPALTVYCTITLSMAYNYSYGAAAAFIAGMVLDVMYGNSFATIGIIFAAASLAGTAAVLRGQRQLSAIFSGGCIAGLLVAVAVSILSRFNGNQLPGSDVPSYLLFSAVFGGIILFLQVLIFDFFAAKANLPCCIKSSYNDPGRRKMDLMRIKMKQSSRRKR